jgi:hypothetical protein
MNNVSFALVLEKMPNSFEPIFLFPNLNELDKFTKNFTREELCKYLIDNHYIDNVDDFNFITIIFNNNGIRRVKEGLITKDIADDNIISIIKNNLLNYQNNGEILNDLFQYLNNKKTINATTKFLLRQLIIDRKNNNNYLLTLTKFNDLSYYDLRTIYLYMINNLQIKLMQNKECHRTLTNNKKMAA